MFKCTYVVLINNNEQNIPDLVQSFKQLVGNFKKEFIIIDDGSKDNSLKTLKKAVNDLPNTTIITQKNKGSSVSINEAINLATGTFIHFVEGDEILNPLSTALLTNACIDYNALVAYGKVTKLKKFGTFRREKCKLLKKSLKDILVHKNSLARNIGSSGTLVRTELIEKIGGADVNIYSPQMSLSLRCALFDSFVFVDNIVTRKIATTKQLDKKFEAYNNLKSIYNFAKIYPQIASELIPELYRALSLELFEVKPKINYYLESIKSKYIKNQKLDTLLELYKFEYEKLL